MEQDGAFDPEQGSSRVRSIEFEGFTLSDVTFAENLELRSHYHERTCLTLVLEGGFVETMGPYALEVDAHSLLVKPAGELHHDEIYRKGVRSMLVSLEPAHERFAEFERLVHAPNLQRHTKLTSVALEMIREHSQPDAFSHLALEGLVMGLVASVGRELTRGDSRSAPSWLDKVLDFIHASPQRRITLAEVASVAGVHQAQVSRVFRRHHRSSLGSYIRKVRLEHAAEQLRCSSRSICEIALLCGFSDQSHLTNAFRREYGVTPSRYRVLNP